MVDAKLHELPSHPNSLNGSPDTIFSCKITRDDHKVPQRWDLSLSTPAEFLASRSWLRSAKPGVESWDVRTFSEKLQESSFHTWNVNPRLLRNQFIHRKVTEHSFLLGSAIRNTCRVCLASSNPDLTFSYVHGLNALQTLSMHFGPPLIRDDSLDQKCKSEKVWLGTLVSRHLFY